MKNCLHCGHECEDNVSLCPRCGRRFSNYTNVKNSDQELKIDFNANNQNQSSDDFASTIKSKVNYNPQESTFSNQIPQKKEGNKLFNSLWVLISFIPFINGFGIFYAGKKTSKRSWIIEGILYEIPVIFHLLSNHSIFTFSLVLLSLIISIIRSMMIITKYKTVLNLMNYKKVNSKILSFLLFISSFIPFLNGVAFIYYGNRYSRPYLIEGFLLEMVWIVEIILFNFIPITFSSISLFVGVAMVSLIISGMSMISFNYDCDALYHHVNNSPINIQENNKRIDKGKYDCYKEQLNDLKDVFDSKEEKVRNLIKERFGTGNITSSRFLTVVNNSHDYVYKELNSGYDLIKYMSEPSQQVENKLKEIITIINSINEEMEKLTVNLLLNLHEDDKSEDNIKNLANDMEDLINDLDKYE